MKTVCISVDGLDYLIRFEYFPETWGESASIEIDEVMACGCVWQMSPEFIAKAEKQILSLYGKALQDQAAEDYATEQYERAYK